MVLKRTGGFSLVELMVVITIIAMLSTGVAIALFHALGRAKVSKAEADIARIDAAVGLYRLATGKYPESLADLEKPVEGYPGGVVPDGIDPDPWGNEYECRRTENGVLVRSFGEDGVEGGENAGADITNRKKEG
jgi:general secretion pathway protein G